MWVLQTQHQELSPFSLSGFIPSKCVLLSLTFYIVDLTKSYRMGVPELSQSLRRVPCSGCGLSKRYILNKEAYNHGFTVVAMDYNLDDEAATLMGNILHCEMGSLVRQSPPAYHRREVGQACEAPVNHD